MAIPIINPIDYETLFLDSPPYTMTELETRFVPPSEVPLDIPDDNNAAACAV